MLLSPYNPNLIKNGKVYWVSEKFDGWRLIYQKGRFLSRTGKEIDVPDTIRNAVIELNLPSHVVLDGELWLGRQTFQQIPTALACKDSKLKYLVFDIPSVQGTFGDRRKTLKRLLSNCCRQSLLVIKHSRISSVEEVDSIYEKFVKKNAEGIVIRSDELMYEFNTRPQHFMKRKPSRDVEVTVIGHANTSRAPKDDPEYISSLVCQINKETFKVSYKARSAPPVGSIVTVSYTELTVRGIPKHAVYIGVREEADCPVTKKPNIKKEVKTSEPLHQSLTSKLAIGQSVDVPSSRGGFYQVRHMGDHLHCNCPAWRFQKRPPKERICKHTTQFVD